LTCIPLPSRLLSRPRCSASGSELSVGSTARDIWAEGMSLLHGRAIEKYNARVVVVDCFQTHSRELATRPGRPVRTGTEVMLYPFPVPWPPTYDLPAGSSSLQRKRDTQRRRSVGISSGCTILVRAAMSAVCVVSSDHSASSSGQSERQSVWCSKRGTGLFTTLLHVVIQVHRRACRAPNRTSGPVSGQTKGPAAPFLLEDISE
jgi:hypothetical protein